MPSIFTPTERSNINIPQLTQIKMIETRIKNLDYPPNEFYDPSSSGYWKHLLIWKHSHSQTRWFLFCHIRSTHGVTCSRRTTHRLQCGFFWDTIDCGNLWLVYATRSREFKRFDCDSSIKVVVSYQTILNWEFAINSQTFWSQNNWNRPSSNDWALDNRHWLLRTHWLSMSFIHEDWFVQFTQSINY